jgi:hypothetical protein
MYSFKYDQQDATIFFIAVNALHVSGGFSTHHRELKTVHTASGMSSLLAATGSVGESNSPKIVVAASKQA